MTLDLALLPRYQSRIILAEAGMNPARELIMMLEDELNQSGIISYLGQIAEEVQDEALAYAQFLGIDATRVHPVIVLSASKIKKGYVAAWKRKDEKNGVMYVHPKALRRGRDYLRHVIAHEILHAILPHNKEHGHNENFNILAAKLRIPYRYRD